MGNDANLDREGCEYGRVTRREFENLKGEVAEVKCNQKETDKTVSKIKEILAANSWQTLIAQLAIQAAFMGLGFWAMIKIVKDAIGG